MNGGVDLDGDEGEQEFQQRVLDMYTRLGREADEKLTKQQRRSQVLTETNMLSRERLGKLQSISSMARFAVRAPATLEAGTNRVNLLEAAAEGRLTSVSEPAPTSAAAPAVPTLARTKSGPSLKRVSMRKRSNSTVSRSSNKLKTGAPLSPRGAEDKDRASPVPALKSIDKSKKTEVIPALSASPRTSATESSEPASSARSKAVSVGVSARLLNQKTSSSDSLKLLKEIADRSEESLERLRARCTAQERELEVQRDEARALRRELDGQQAYYARRISEFETMLESSWRDCRERGTDARMANERAMRAEEALAKARGELECDLAEKTAEVRSLQAELTKFRQISENPATHAEERPARRVSSSKGSLTELDVEALRTHYHAMAAEREQQWRNQETRLREAAEQYRQDYLYEREARLSEIWLAKASMEEKQRVIASLLAQLAASSLSNEDALARVGAAASEHEALLQRLSDSEMRCVRLQMKLDSVANQSAELKDDDDDDVDEGDDGEQGDDVEDLTSL